MVILRIDAEASLLKEKLDRMESSGEIIGDGYEKASKEATIATIEVNLSSDLDHLKSHKYLVNANDKAILGSFILCFYILIVMFSSRP